MNKTINKQETLSAVTNHINNLFIEIDLIQDKLKEENTKLLLKTKEYTDIVTSLNEVKEDIDKQLNSIKKKEEGLTEKENELNDKIVKHEKTKTELDSEINNKVIVRNNLLTQITELEDKLKLIVNEVKVKELLSKELIDIKAQIKEDSKLLQDIQTEYAGFIERFDSEKKILNKELLDLENLVKEKLKVVIPTIEDLNKRESDIVRKENDLNIVIERYRKIFKDNNIGFKI